jgi:putative transcriptional regulator
MPSHDELRFFLGYAGWGEGQLESELEAGGWIPMPASADLVFPAEPETLWRDAMIHLGGEYALLANYPDDPRAN